MRLAEALRVPAAAPAVNWGVRIRLLRFAAVLATVRLAEIDVAGALLVLALLAVHYPC